MKEQIRKFIETQTGSIPDNDWTLYEQQLIPRSTKKGDVLLEYNKPCSTIWHMVSGAVRKTEMNEGVSKTTHFYTAPKIFTVLQSALTCSPSDLSIICEEDCQFFELPFTKVQELYEQSRYIERIGRRMVEEEFIEEFSIRRMFLKMDALQRYEYLEQSHPGILQRFQLKDIATFLGVAPETLSRLRKTRLIDGRT